MTSRPPDSVPELTASPISFSLWYDFRNPPRWRRRESDLYGELLDQIEWADGLSAFEHVWLSEHHFTDDGYLPSVLPMLAALSQRTSALRLGTQALLAPLHHPLRIAEDVAVADQLSGGRVSLGLAIGYREKEFDVLGVPKRERGSRTSETLELLRLAWRGTPFDFRGRHFEFRDVTVRPRPAQDEVPIWVGGSSLAAAGRAARYGCHFMSDEGTPAEVVEAYLAGIAAYGPERSGARVSTNRVIYVCDDPDQGWHDVREHFLYVYNGYRRWYEEAGELAEMGPALDDPDLLPRELHVVGTPQMVIEEIARQRREIFFDSLTFWAHPPGLDVTKSTRSIELFARHVAPAFR